MPHMVNNIFQRSDNFRTVYQNVPIMVNGGYVFILSRMLKLKPNFLFKWVDKRAVELDINANFLFDEVLWLGFSYKFSNAANIILEMQVTDQFRLGYSYSITTGPLRKAELGSHEVLLSYRFKYFSKGIVTPRYF
jgi:type IX secretion system PorP/SprF family membrane protein